jgi:hypothetical protein
MLDQIIAKSVETKLLFGVLSGELLVSPIALQGCLRKKKCNAVFDFSHDSSEPGFRSGFLKKA